MRIFLTTAAALVLLVGSGCKRSTRSEEQSTTDSGAPIHRIGNPPSTWKVVPPIPARKASYLVRDNGGAVVDISLAIQPGSIGDLHQIVNQWRTQLGVPPLERASYEQSVRRLTTPAGEARVIDIIGSVTGTESAYDGHLIAAVVPRPHETWIFRMRGNAALVTNRKQEFLDWVLSIQPDDIVNPQPLVPILPQPTPPGSTLQPEPGHQPTWKLPAGWTTGPAESNCFATFPIPAANDDSARVIVAMLDSDAGAPLNIVNHCRSQLGLTPIPRNALADATQSIWNTDAQMTMIDLVDHPTRHTVAAWTPRSDGTWFFMLSGPSPVVAAQRQHFALFLKSIRFAEDTAAGSK